MKITEVEEKMMERVNFFEESLSEIRAGRANPAILNKVMVEYYGTLTPINQVSSVSVPEARQILVTPWDRSMLGAVEKAIQKADIGINPLNDGSCVRIIFPELNEDRRRELVKEVKSLGEDAKVALRNVRRDGMDDAKASQKAGEITEDDLNDAEEKIQKITNKYTEIVDSTISSKEKEIMEV